VLEVINYLITLLSHVHLHIRPYYTTTTTTTATIIIIIIITTTTTTITTTTATTKIMGGVGKLAEWSTMV